MGFEQTLAVSVIIVFGVFIIWGRSAKGKIALKPYITPVDNKRRKPTTGSASKTKARMKTTTPKGNSSSRSTSKEGVSSGKSTARRK